MATVLLSAIFLNLKSQDAELVELVLEEYL